jgi:diguanylate cyclase (GGDEF)-like protein/PAS domain S-box-containing protein
MPTDESKPLAPPPVRDYQDLKDSEERLQAFMDHSPVLAFMKDDEGRYVYLNPKMESTFHVALEDVRGKADFDWLPEDVAQTVRENDRLVLSTRQVVETLESLVTPDGVRQWMVVKFPFVKPDGRVFVGGVAVDVTTLHITRERLAESESRYRHLVDSSQGLICTHDLQGRLLSVNPAALALLGYMADELIGRNMRELLPASAVEEFDRYLQRMNTQLTDTGLMQIAGKDGAEHVWQYHNVKITESGEAPYVLGHAQDVTELRAAQEQLRKLSLTDELTGVRNRRGFFTLAPQLLQKVVASGSPTEFSVVYVDVDGLKRVNDAYGHDAGSEVIVAAADVLTNTFRAADIVARLGGDEFVVLAAVPRASQDLIFERMQHHQDVFNARSGRPYTLTLSIGIASLDAGGNQALEEAVKRADTAMYLHKRSKAAAR